jgi:hypothetical protein
MEPKEGYVRYRNKKEDHWTGLISESLLLPRKIQIMRFQGYEFEKDYSHIPPLEIPSPPRGIKVRNLDTSNMQEDTTYVVCPDRTCGLFWENDIGGVCENHCPKKDKRKLVVVCHDCESLLVLPDNHSCMQRLDHDCKNMGCKFRLRSHTLQLMYKMPKANRVIKK